MGKCSVCGKKIQYNQFKVVKNKVYCPKCEPPKVAEIKIRRGRKRKSSKKKA